MAQTNVDFDDLDLESASGREVVLEDAPVAKIILPSLSNRKQPAIKINLQNPGTKKSTDPNSSLKPEANPSRLSPVQFPQTPPKKELSAKDKELELRRLRTLHLPGANNAKLFRTERSHGFRIVCEACKVSCTSEINLIDHSNGKRHKAAIARLEMANAESIKLAPGEPVPPGFENEMDRVPMCQQMLDEFQDSPVIGLEYLVEIMAEDDENSRLVCFLCDKKAEHPLQYIRQNIISHVIGTSHRSAYIKKHFPAVYEAVQNTTNEQGKKVDTGRIIRIVSANIENDYGRLKPTITEKRNFHINVDEIREKIENDKHFSETPEKNYVDIVNPREQISLMKFEADDSDSEVTILPREQGEVGAEETAWPKKQSSPLTQDIFDGRSTSDKKEKTESHFKKRNTRIKDDNGHLHKKSKDDVDLGGTSPISNASETLTLSSCSSPSRAKSPVRVDELYGFRGRYGRQASPVRHRMSPSRRWSPDHSRRYGDDGRISSHHFSRIYRSRSPQHSRSRSPGRSRRSRSPVSYRSRHRSRSRERRRRDSNSPRMHRSRSPGSRSGSPASVDTRNSWTIPGRGVHRSGVERSSRSERSPVNDVVKKRDKWVKFREEADKIEVKMEELRRFHTKNPEKHPLYKEEWKKFWNKRYAELQATGRDAASYDYKPEWIEFWNHRVDELHAEEFKVKKENLKHQLELSDEDEPEAKQRIPVNFYHNRASARDFNDPGMRDYRQKRQAASIVDSGHEPPPAKPRSPSWAPPDRFHRSNAPAYEGTYKVIAVLRMLTALESQLGSLGPRVNALLAQAISLDKAEYGSSEVLARNMDNIVLFETVKEKLKGMLMAGVVEKVNVNATRLVIADLTELLDKAPPPIESTPSGSKPAVKQKQENPLVAVPGVGETDRAAIAMQLAEALVAQGKTDVTHAELNELVDALLAGMAGKQTEKTTTTTTTTTQVTTVTTSAAEVDTPEFEESGVEEVISKKVEARKREKPVTSTTSEALKSIQSSYKSNITPQMKSIDVTIKKPMLENVAQISDLCEADLKACLRIFKYLTQNEQRSLIMYLKKLEEEDPGRVESLRKFVNLSPTKNGSDDEGEVPPSKIKFTDGPTSPFSVRQGGSNPFHNDSDEEYSFEDVCKAAVRNVDAKQRASEELEKRKRLDELAKLKHLNKPADNNAIKQAIEATTDTMMASLITSRKDANFTGVKPVSQATSLPQTTRSIMTSFNQQIPGLNTITSTRFGKPSQPSTIYTANVPTNRFGTTMQQQIPTLSSSIDRFSKQIPTVSTTSTTLGITTHQQQQITNLNTSNFGVPSTQQQQMPSTTYGQPYGVQQGQFYEQNVQYPAANQYPAQQQPVYQQQTFGTESYYQYNPAPVQSTFTHLQQPQADASYHPAQYSASYEKRQKTMSQNQPNPPGGW